MILVFMQFRLQDVLKSKPDNVISTVKFAPSGVDEMSGIVMTNKEGQMTVISLSLHTKQPKRCVICGDKGYIEIMEYPRACKATIVCTETGERKEICEGETEERCSMKWRIWRRRFQSEAVVCLGSIQKTLWKL